MWAQHTVTSTAVTAATAKTDGDIPVYRSGRIVSPQVSEGDDCCRAQRMHRINEMDENQNPLLL